MTLSSLLLWYALNHTLPPLPCPTPPFPAPLTTFFLTYLQRFPTVRTHRLCSHQDYIQRLMAEKADLDKRFHGMKDELITRLQNACAQRDEARAQVQCGAGQRGTQKGAGDGGQGAGDTYSQVHAASRCTQW